MEKRRGGDNKCGSYGEGGCDKKCVISFLDPSKE
jgi:hypothetical protein